MTSFHDVHPIDPVTGRFVTKNVTEAATTALALLRPTDGLAERRSALESGGFVPAVVIRSDVQGAARDWWDVHTIAARYDPDVKVARMQRLSSNGRVVARRRYEGRDKTWVTMPNASAIRKFSAETGHDVFDIPVSGAVNGCEVSAWVRARQTSPGVWVTEVVGDPDHPMAEAVSAILEARRVTHGLREAGDLLNRRRERARTAGTELSDLSSSWVSGVGYDPNGQVMVTKVSDRVYGHVVSRETFEAVRGAASPGAAFNQLVKGRGRALVMNCETCGRFYSEHTHHVCPTNVLRPCGEQASTVAHDDQARSSAVSLIDRIFSSTRRATAPPEPDPPDPRARRRPRPTPVDQERESKYAALLSVAARSVARAAARFQLRREDREDLASRVIEACLSREARAAEANEPFELHDGYVWKVAQNLVSKHDGMWSPEVAARGMLSAAVDQLQQEQGRQASDQQVAELARKIRDEWSGPKRPPRDFYVRTEIVHIDGAVDDLDHKLTSVALLHDHAGSYDPSALSQQTLDSHEVAFMSLIEQHEEASGKLEHQRVRRAVWDALAASTGAPRASTNVPSRHVYAARRIMAAHPDGPEGGVAAAIETWRKGEEDDYTRALFTPFGDLDEEGRDAVTSLLSMNRAYMASLWSAAMSQAFYGTRGARAAQSA